MVYYVKRQFASAGPRPCVDGTGEARHRAGANHPRWGRSSPESGRPALPSWLGATRRSPVRPRSVRP